MISRNSGNFTISSGIILVEAGTVLPDPIRLVNDFGGSGWAQVDNADGCALERQLNDAGWTFFYMAGTIQACALGFERKSTINVALQRLFVAVRRHGCNCLEIDDVTTRSFCGLPYVCVSAHSRHIQKGMILEPATVSPR